MHGASHQQRAHSKLWVACCVSVFLPQAALSLLPSAVHIARPLNCDQALLGKGTRDLMVGWLAGVMEGNGERGKMQWSHERGASHSFFLNHNAVMLALAGPFLESPNFWKRYVHTLLFAHRMSHKTTIDSNYGKGSQLWKKKAAREQRVVEGWEGVRWAGNRAGTRCCPLTDGVSLDVVALIAKRCLLWLFLDF
jgi:hypothetical protein